MGLRFVRTFTPTNGNEKAFDKRQAWDHAKVETQQTREQDLKEARVNTIEELYRVKESAQAKMEAYHMKMSKCALFCHIY